MRIRDDLLIFFFCIYRYDMYDFVVNIVILQSVCRIVEWIGFQRLCLSDPTSTISLEIPRMRSCHGINVHGTGICIGIT